MKDLGASPPVSRTSVWGAVFRVPYTIRGRKTLRLMVFCGIPIDGLSLTVAQ